MNNKCDKGRNGLESRENIDPMTKSITRECIISMRKSSSGVTREFNRATGDARNIISRKVIPSTIDRYYDGAFQKARNGVTPVPDCICRHIFFLFYSGSRVRARYSDSSHFHDVVAVCVGFFLTSRQVRQNAGHFVKYAYLQRARYDVRS